LEFLDSAVKRALSDLYEQLRQDKDPAISKGSTSKFLFKPHVHTRISMMPVCAHLYRLEFPSCKDSGNFFCLVGTVVRVGPAKLLEYAKTYQCNKCKNQIDVKAIPSKFHSFPKHVECPNLCLNAKVSPVGKENSKTSEHFSKFKDYQEIKLQVNK